ncbi:MAG: hypothetical protein IM613_17170 [Cytophagales bacterium]|nr:hypothetical protein [Cytophagales bacterium]
MDTIKPGHKYVFDPVLWDVIDPKTDLAPGTIVSVVKSPMGFTPIYAAKHCFVIAEGSRGGLVHINSLKPIKS